MRLFDLLFKKKKIHKTIMPLTDTPINTQIEDLDKRPPPMQNETLHHHSDANFKVSDDILPNGNTIAEQQKLDYQIALGQYPKGVPSFLDMKIVSNTVPPLENYDVLNEDEQKFFTAFHTALVVAKYNPSLVRLTRLSSGTFNVDYVGMCYVGKIDLYKHPDSTTYAVIKKGNKRATKLFSSLAEAQSFADTNDLYEVQIRTVTYEPQTYMQYQIGITSVKELHNPTLQQCIDTIPRWIKYLNYCKRN